MPMTRPLVADGGATALQGATSAFDVHIRKACLAYGGQTLFDNLDLDIRAGAWTCIVGPSGVGKSTLLKLIAGLQADAAQGTVEASDGAPLTGRAAYMAQQDLLLPWLSVLDNITIGARLRRTRPDVERARALLAAVGLAGREHDRPAALSGGMRQRVALARTLMEERPLVLMDEPFSALDAITRLELQALAARLLAGRTVVLVTHDPVEALRLGDRVLLLAGRPVHITEIGVPDTPTPRDPADPSLSGFHAALLDALGAVHRHEQGRTEA